MRAETTVQQAEAEATLLLTAPSVTAAVEAALTLLALNTPQVLAALAEAALTALAVRLEQVGKVTLAVQAVLT